MKKALVLILILMLSLLTACGGQLPPRSPGGTQADSTRDTQATSSQTPPSSTEATSGPTVPEEPEAVSMDDFNGRWYSYTRDMLLEIDYDTFTMIEVEDDYESTGSCTFSDETLTLEFDDEYYADWELTITLEGSIAGGLYGHFRPQPDETLADPPIDLSAESYLGEWYCDEIDEAIYLGWTYTVQHTTGAGSDETAYTSDGNYEPYGNLLVLGYTGTLGGEETIFNGGDAVYDPDAQTLTTADKYVYERVSYGGGLKTISSGNMHYDFFDWGSPYITREEIAAEIIAAWQENGEDVAPEYLDVENLIAAINADDSDEEYIFIIACNVAGVDYATYFGFGR